MSDKFEDSVSNRHDRVRIGQIWRDKDPRSPNQVTVLQIEWTGFKDEDRRRKDRYRVQIQRHSRKVWVRLDRFIKKFAQIVHTEETP